MFECIKRSTSNLAIFIYKKHLHIISKTTDTRHLLLDECGLYLNLTRNAAIFYIKNYIINNVYC